MGLSKDTIICASLSALLTFTMLFSLSFTGTLTKEIEKEYVIIGMDQIKIIPPEKKAEKIIPKKEKIIKIEKPNEPVVVKKEEVKIPKIEEEVKNDPPPLKEEPVVKQEPDPKPQPAKPTVAENSVKPDVKFFESKVDVPYTMDISVRPGGNHPEGERTNIPTSKPNPNNNGSENGIEGGTGKKLIVSDEIETVESTDKDVAFKILDSFKPVYPETAREFDISATVVVKVLIGVDGKIEKIEFIKSVEEFGFNKAVSDALKHWRFSVKKKRNKVKCVYIIPFPFEYE